MNWAGSMLKADAREVLKASYWRCLLAGVAAIVAMGVIRVIAPGNLKTVIEGNLRMITSYDLHKWANMYSQMPQYHAPNITPAMTFGMVLKLFSPRMLWSLTCYYIKGTIIRMIVRVLLLQPLEVGCKCFFHENLYEDAPFISLISGFMGNYFNVVRVQFLRAAVTSAWALLFFVPGVIRNYELRMVPYLLADYPDMSTKEAFELSKKMMEGEKMNVFLLDLSFVGWGILSAATFGIVWVLYVQPYKELTDAGLYASLSEKYGRDYAVAEYSLIEPYGCGGDYGFRN